MAKSVNSIDPALETFANPRQLEYIDAIRKNGGITAAAKALNVGQSTISESIDRLKKSAALRGYAPEHDLKKPVANGQYLRGASTLYDKDGNLKLQWVKSATAPEVALQVLTEAAATAFRDYAGISPKIPMPKTKAMTPELLAVYKLGDPHLGMLAWGKQSGEDFDLEIAQRDLLTAMDYLVSMSPAAETALILNAGDFFHTDNMDNETWRNRHKLDVDGRWSKIVAVGIRLTRRLIERALEKHKRVIVRCNIGNHDDHSSQWLAQLLMAVYENNPRVQVDPSENHFYYLEFGANMIASAHGNHGKPRDYPEIMATDQPAMWGRTRHRICYLGHVHHESVFEGRGAVVEYLRTLAARDNYAHENLYRSGRDMQCDVWHEETGRYLRAYSDISMVRKIQRLSA